jgi:hypothetical protein
MASIQLRNIPEDLYKEIAKRAKEENRTIPQQTINMLRKQLANTDDNYKKRDQILENLRKNPFPAIDIDWVVKEIRKDRDAK